MGKNEAKVMLILTNCKHQKFNTKIWKTKTNKNHTSDNQYITLYDLWKFCGKSTKKYFSK